MKINVQVGSGAKLLLGATACLWILISSCIASSAESASSLTATSPSGSTMTSTLVPAPSLLMEGTGYIRPSSPECTRNICAGTFTATLSGRPFGQAHITLDLSVNQTGDQFTGCKQLVGTGGINNDAYIAVLIGQLCVPTMHTSSGVGYTLSGMVQIYAPAAGSSTAAVGTLLAFGGTNIPPNPIPNSGPSLVSLLGASGTIPLLLP
jgi:hypothetical protein